MIIGDRQKIFKAGIDPDALRDPLALGAMSVTTRIGKAICMAAMITDIYMIAKITAPAVFDVKHHRVLFAAKLMTGPVFVPVLPEDVSNF